MAKKSMILKQQGPAKYSTRKYNRCKICGRPHAYLRNYGICRICFRELAYKGQIPGRYLAGRCLLRHAQKRRKTVRFQTNCLKQNGYNP